MSDKGLDTDEEFNDVLSDNEISGKVSEPEYDPPDYDPNPYMGNVILSPAPAPAPQGDVVDAEFLEESEEIKKLNERIDGLEEKIRICCPEKKEEKAKIDVTRGWIIIRGGSAYSGKIGPLSGPREIPPRNSGRNEVIESMGLVGYSERNGVNGDTTTWWPRDQTQDPGEMLEHTIKERHTDTHIAPGVPLDLIKKKIKEGFVIEFESDKDRETFLEMGGEEEEKAPKKYTAYTENWVYLPQSTAFPGENHYPTHESIEQGKKYTLAHDEGGFDWARGRAWIRSHTKEEVLADASNKGKKYQDAIKHNDTVYIVPGIDIKLLVDKSKEGYSIEFESDKDRKTFLEMGGKEKEEFDSDKDKKTFLEMVGKEKEIIVIAGKYRGLPLVEAFDRITAGDKNYPIIDWCGRGVLDSRDVERAKIIAREYIHMFIRKRRMKRSLPSKRKKKSGYKKKKKKKSKRSSKKKKSKKTKRKKKSKRSSNKKKKSKRKKSRRSSKRK